MKYRALRAFRYKGKPVKAGDIMQVDDSEAVKLKANNLIYHSKEEKRVYQRDVKATIEHDAGPMFYVKRGHQIIDRLKKAEAEALRDELNEK